MSPSFGEQASAGKDLFFSRKDLIPTSIIFLGISLYLTYLKVMLTTEQINAMFEENFIWMLLQTFTLYFAVYFFLSFTGLSGKLIIRVDSFFGTLGLNLLWFFGIMAFSYFFPLLSLIFLGFYMLIGTFFWLLVNSFVLNGSLMEQVGIATSQGFSKIKWVIGFILWGICAYVSYIYWQMHLIQFIYWIGFSIFIGFAILVIPSRAISTALYYISVFLYFSLFLMIYLSSSDSEYNGPLNEHTLQIISVVVYYIVLLGALGQIAANIKTQSAFTTISNIKIFFVFFTAIAYLIFEFVYPQIFTEDSNPALSMLEYRFIFVTSTAIFVYIYQTIKGFVKRK